MKTSYWLDRPRRARLPWTEATDPATYDAVVAGAGITGVLTALHLARAGLSVALLEARRIGDGATGRSTAKVSLLQGARPAAILERHGEEMLQRYVTANREGQAWLRRYLDEHSVPYDAQPAYSYATTRAGVGKLSDERAAAEAAGLAVRDVSEPGLPFPVLDAIALDDQFAIDPVLVLEALLDELEQAGGHVHENTRVVDVRLDEAHAATVTVEDGGQVRAGVLVLAMGTPFPNRSGWFARLEARRSYAVTAHSPWLPRGLYLSTDSPLRSLRTANGPDGPRLLAGGGGHVTGRGGPEDEQLADLRSWTKGLVEGVEITHSWSAQDLHPIAGLPYAGPVLPHDERVLAATGYAKWGFTNASAASLLLAKHVLGGLPDWGEVYATWSAEEIKALPSLLGANFGVAREMVAGHASRGPLQGSDRKAPVCTHLGGRLRWNPAEETWDCPLHGSRFDAAGAVLCGPAVRPLRTTAQASPEERPAEPPAARH